MLAIIVIVVICIPCLVNGINIHPFTKTKNLNLEITPRPKTNQLPFSGTILILFGPLMLLSWILKLLPKLVLVLAPVIYFSFCYQSDLLCRMYISDHAGLCVETPQ